MINPTYPGVYVREEASGARAIAGVATSITAFVGMTQRGKIEKPKRIFNLRDYERNFGLGTDMGEMTEQVKLFFDNGGGEAWITRIAKDSAKAKVTLKDLDEDDSMEISALEAGADGNNIRAEVDYNTPSPEATFNMRVFRRYLNDDGSENIQDIETFTNLSMDPDSRGYVEKTVNSGSGLVSVEVSTPGTNFTSSRLYSGLIFPALGVPDTDMTTTLQHKFSTADGITPTDGAFNIKINGGPTIPVNITLPTDAANLLVVLKSGIESHLASAGITVTVTCIYETLGSGERLLRIEMPGQSFEITGAATANDIAQSMMLAPVYGGVYLDHYALNRPTPSGYVSRLSDAAGNNTISRLIDFGNSAKDTLTDFSLTDSSGLGPHSFTPLAFTGNNAAGTKFFDGTVFVPTHANDFSVGSFLNLSEHLGTLGSAITNNSNGQWDAAVHGHRLVLTPTANDSGADLGAALTTDDGGGGGYQIEAAGRLFTPSQKPENVKSYAVGQIGGSGGPGDFQNASVPGADGFVPEEQQYKDAFVVIEKEVDLFNLMVLPRAKDDTGSQSDVDRKVAFNAASAFCAKERAFLLVDPPSDPGAGIWKDADTAATGSNAMRIGIDPRNSAVYWPRLSKADGSFQDPGGAMAGLMARIDGTRGVWKAPAGVEATIRSVNGVEYMMSDPENGLINPQAVNAVRVFPDGVLSWGARTLVGHNASGNIDDKYIPVRRTMLFIEESLYRGLRFAVFEPNDEPLWAQIRLAAGSFMNTLFRQGAFAGQKASDAYYVLCDSSTTTETDKNLGIVNVVVAFAPLKPAEFVILTVKQIAGQVQT